MGNIPPWIDLISGDEIVSNCEPQDDGSVLIKSKVTIPCSTYGEVCKVSGTEVVTEEKSANFDLNVGDLVYSVRTYNKVLTTVQKAKNAALDKKRFKYIPSAKSYVKDGLVFQIDCTQEPTIDGDKATLKDLASGIVLTGLNKNSIQRGSDGSLLLMNVSNDTSFLNIQNPHCTIEIISNTGELGYCDNEFTMQISSSKEGLTMRTMAGSAGCSFEIGEKGESRIGYFSKASNELKIFSGISFGINSNTYYENGTEKETWSSGSSSYEYTGINIESLENIYSFRIYNRVLTDVERQRNYLIDQARFSIPANALYDDNGNLLYDDSGNLLLSDN